MATIFASVLDIWLIWVVALLLLAICCRRVIGRFGIVSCRRFNACEEGASYALPYVLTFPIFVLLMAIFVQASLILMCKIGTVYSAYSSARTYIVWQSAAQNETVGGVQFDFAKFKAMRAASMAMVPFASSNPQHLKNMYPGFPSLNGSTVGTSVFPSRVVEMLTKIDEPQYSKVYYRLLSDANKHDTGPVHKIIQNRLLGAKRAYVRNKYKFAAASTRVTLPEQLVPWNQDVTVKVRYRMPFHVPGTARILGGKSMRTGWFFGPTTFYRDIETTVTLPSEAAKTPHGKIGIPYQPSLILELVK